MVNRQAHLPQCFGRHAGLHQGTTEHLVQVVAGQPRDGIGGDIQRGGLVHIFFAVGDTTDVVQLVVAVVNLQLVVENVGIFEVNGIEITGFIGGAVGVIPA